MKRISILISFLIIFFISSCKASVEYNFETDFIFSDDIDDSLVLEFEEAAVKLLEKLEDLEILTDRKVYFNVSVDADEYVDYDSVINVIYVNIDSKDSLSMVLLVLQSVYPKDANYGLIYGLSEFISEDINYSGNYNVTKSEDNIISSILSEKWYLKDMVFPCFDSRFTEDDDIDISKSLSIYFTKFIIDDVGIDYLNDFIIRSNKVDLFYEQYNVILQLWSNTISNDYEFEITSSEVFFVNNITNSELIWTTQHAVWVTNISNGDRYVGYLYEDDFYSNIELLMTTINDFEEELLRLDSILYFSENDCSKLTINIYSEEFPSLTFYSENLEGYASTIISFSKVYVYYIDACHDRYLLEWVEEARGRYYSLFSKYNQEYFEYIVEFEHENLSENIVDLQEAYSDLLVHKGTSFDYESDIFLLMDIYASNLDVIPNIEILMYPHYYQLWISLFNYISNTYGEDELHALSFNNQTFTNGIETSWEELIDEWIMYIENEEFYE